MKKEHLISISKHSYDIGGQFHILKSGKMPSSIQIRDFHKSKGETVFKQILDKYEWEEENYIQNIDHLDKVVRHYFVYLNNNISLSISTAKFTMYFDHSSDKQAVEEIKKLTNSVKSEKSSTQNIGVIVSNGMELVVKTFEYSLPKQSLIEYMDADTQNFHKKMVDQLKHNDGAGLYLIYGEPGTGKTSFIKDVLAKTEKQALFISPNFTDSLTSPGLISLLMKYPDSILVIEDAETVLMERKADNSSAVSNLLNLTDGFLADFLNLKIICTFNTDLNTIDEALLREGRLKGMHEFTKIQPHKAKEIADALGTYIDPDGPMTLAEICSSEAYSTEYKPKKIGFGSTSGNGNPF